MINCRDCKFWHKEADGATYSNYGKCKMYPPRGNNYRPQMPADDGCGQGVEIARVECTPINAATVKICPQCLNSLMGGIQHNGQTYHLSCYTTKYGHTAPTTTDTQQPGHNHD